MKTCIFCDNIRVFSIHKEYGNSAHTIKDDLIEFFGYGIETDLLDTDVICNVCMTVMENVANLKRRLLPLISRLNSPERKPVNLGKKWATLASMSSCGRDDELTMTPQTSPLETLLELKKAVKYDRVAESFIEERLLRRSSSVVSDVNSEIVRTFKTQTAKKGRRRRRGHNWTRRKNGRNSRVSLMSRRSISSKVTYMDSPFDTYTFDSFSLNSPLPRVYSAAPSPIESEDTVEGVDDDSNLFQCSKCDYFCESAESLIDHKIHHHNVLALFNCNYCKKNYTTREELTIHERIHNQSKNSCAICRQQFNTNTAYIKHWQYHKQNSVLCKICGRKFANNPSLRRHREQEHKANHTVMINYK